MTTVDKEIEKGRDAQNRVPGKRAKAELVGIFLLCLLLSIFVSVRKTQEIMERNDLHIVHMDQHAQHLPVRTVGTEPLKHEDMFLETIKSCLPESNKNCKLFIPEHTTAQRVAVIAPPGDLAEAFLQLIQFVIGKAQRKKKVEVELFPTTHIPPYGYGKTHGWTKIIRIVPKPLLLGTTNALRMALDIGEPIDGITGDDIKAGLRQQIRYHCRLNHVAAHTALWSIDLETLVEISLDDLIDKTQVFLGLDGEIILDEMVDSKDGDDNLRPPENLETLFVAMASHGASLLTHAQTSMQRSILKELDEVLLEEMRISKNLTAWPCESFWTVGNMTKDPLELSPIVSRISQSMSPNCTAPFSSCFVKRDKCEAAGDGKCQGT